MTSPLYETWFWLPTADSYEVAAEGMARTFADPVAFWQRIQGTIQQFGKSPDSIDAAKVEIAAWLAKHRTQWQNAHDNCELPDPWKGRNVDFGEAAARFTGVLDALPEALEHYKRAKNKMAAEPDRGVPNVEIDRTCEGSLGMNEERELRWRFFGDPEVHNRQILHFPVAVVKDLNATVDSGQILQMTIEILEPGLGNVIRHPLLELSGVQVDPDFHSAADLAFQAASAVSGRNQTTRFTAGYFLPQFFEHKVTDLIGKSTGGAFALAFSRALQKQVYDQRVLVIATVIDTEGRLGPVDNDGADPRLMGRTFLYCKAGGILAHNRALGVNAPTRIDTVAVVREQKMEMEKAMKDAWNEMSNKGSVTSSELDEVRIVAIEDFATDAR